MSRSPSTGRASSCTMPPAASSCMSSRVRWACPPLSHATRRRDFSWPPIPAAMRRSGASTAQRPSRSSSSPTSSPTPRGSRRRARWSARRAIRAFTRSPSRSRRAVPQRSSKACGSAYPRSPMAAEVEVREALARASNAEALDLALQALDAAPSPELEYLAALACSRMGAASEALARLDRIEAGGLDATLAAEVKSLAGRLAKDRGDAREALDRYREALRLAPAAYPAVNAATMAHLLGDGAARDGLAAEALRLLPPRCDHWEWASRGEALLLLGRIEEAREAYARARALAGARHGDVASM